MNILQKIQEAIDTKNYALRPHAISHMVSDGFGEIDIVEAIENGKILENYTDEERCLIAGSFQVTEKNREDLHIVVDYWSESQIIEWVDIVTAYIPRYPYWETTYKRGKK